MKWEQGAARILVIEGSAVIADMSGVPYGHAAGALISAVSTVHTLNKLFTPAADTSSDRGS